MCAGRVCRAGSISLEPVTVSKAAISKDPGLWEGLCLEKVKRNQDQGGFTQAWGHPLESPYYSPRVVAGSPLAHAVNSQEIQQEAGGPVAQDPCLQGSSG